MPQSAGPEARACGGRQLGRGLGCLPDARSAQHQQAAHTMAGADDPTLTNVAGYAILGGVFFLISAFRLGRTAKGN